MQYKCKPQQYLVHEILLALLSVTLSVTTYLLCREGTMLGRAESQGNNYVWPVTRPYQAG